MLFLLLECPSLLFLKVSQAVPVASSDPLGSATPSSELPELSILPLLALISLTQNDLFTRLFSPEELRADRNHRKQDASQADCQNRGTVDLSPQIAW